MLVYGDVECLETVGAKLAEIEAGLNEAGRMTPGIERHTALVAAFIGASELVQALIDQEFHERGFDAPSSLHQSGMECLSKLAHAVLQSWRSHFAWYDPRALNFEWLSPYEPSREIRTKRAEGYAFYALFPESYLEAAAASGLGADTCVIGIRSIGAGLSALVAAALGAPSPFTVRPVGHPFERTVKVDAAFEADLASRPTGQFAIVDEGPGLSGSSFGAVADWLEQVGVPRAQIHFFPSHGGMPGSQASGSHRERWDKAHRHVVHAGQLLCGPSGHLRQWVEDVLGPLDAPLEDLSGGAWRSKHYGSEDEWPAANIHQERLKYLATAQGEAWLVKFVGLGPLGEQKASRAQVLNEAGFTPDVAGFRHGFLVERWHGDAKPLAQCSINREWLVDQVGRYLGFRTRHAPAGANQGASLTELARMAVYNVCQALGQTAGDRLEAHLAHAHALEAGARPVDTDNRMHRQEWLLLGSRLIKTDAIDHNAAHDLIGPQDIAWDIVGAAVELDLSHTEAQMLCRIVEQTSGRPVSARVLDFMYPCYLAFQMGAHRMASDGLVGPECERLRQASQRYASLLGDWLKLNSLMNQHHGNHRNSKPV
jgi:hypothetical protein